MMKSHFLFNNIVHTPGVLYTLIRNVNRQKKILDQHIVPELAAAMKTNDGSLDQEDIAKILNYYALAVPAILGEALCVLRGTKMTYQERLALTCQGAITGLGDDFFDKQNMPDDLIKTLIEKPDELNGSNTNEQLFLTFYKRALNKAHNPALMLHYLRQVFAAQIKSRKQSKPGLLTKDALLEVTIEKGAASILFYRSVLINPLTKEEEVALYQLGGLLQLGNDIFDLYKDCQKRIDTLITTAKKVQEVREIFLAQMEKSFSLCYKMNYPRRNITQMLRLITMSICSRCIVCLNQLGKKEKETGGNFLPYQYERKDLVCDMQKVGNKWGMILNFINNRI